MSQGMDVRTDRWVMAVAWVGHVEQGNDLTGDVMGGEPAAPEPFGVRTEAEFVALLRQLKNWSGLTYRQLERRAEREGSRVARSTIAAALSRSSLPRREVVEGLVRACGRQPTPWLQALRRLALDSPGQQKREREQPPRQLPIPTGALVGRAPELALLDRVLNEPAPSVNVLALSGPPGSGKSSLALHAARLAAANFPDGQLYVDLQGSTPDAAPLTPLEVARRLLRGLGLPDAAVPPTAEEAAALLRGTVAERRLLVLLDGAAGAAQVRPLLPLGERAVVVLTSRSTLTSLERSRQIVVDVVSPVEAALMLEGLLGVERTRAEPAALTHLAALCGHLPLALRVAAGRLIARPDWLVKDMVRRLDDDRYRLDELWMDDIDVRASLVVSYTALAQSSSALDREALRVFHLIGTLDSPQATTTLAARLLGTPPAETDRAISQLVSANLVRNVGDGHYRMPDLVWLLARQQATAATDLRSGGLRESAR